jgi:hypothetical protein
MDFDILKTDWFEIHGPAVMAEPALVTFCYEEFFSINYSPLNARVTRVALYNHQTGHWWPADEDEDEDSTWQFFVEPSVTGTIRPFIVEVTLCEDTPPKVCVFEPSKDAWKDGGGFYCGYTLKDEDGSVAKELYRQLVLHDPNYDIEGELLPIFVKKHLPAGAF